MRPPSLLGVVFSLFLLSCLAACAKKQTEETIYRDTGELPYGTWLVVDIQKDLPGDMTVLLTLDRFTFGWTTIIPFKQTIFYEAADMVYDRPERRLTFKVKTSKVMDQISGIPKEVFDPPRMESRSHVPGEQYSMTWAIGENDVLVLRGPKTEITYLRRVKPNPADSTVIDLKKEAKN